MPKVGLLDGPDCRERLCRTLLGRDRLVAAVVNDDVHIWLGHAEGTSHEKWLWRGACSAGTGDQDTIRAKIITVCVVQIFIFSN